MYFLAVALSKRLERYMDFKFELFIRILDAFCVIDELVEYVM